MLKNVFSKIVISALSIAIFSPFLKSYSAQAVSFSPLIEFNFYQSGFPNNGFLKGYFYGKDVDNSGYISFSDASFSKENSDDGMIFLEYFSGNEGKTFFFNTVDTVMNEFFYRYSLSSKKLTGDSMTGRSDIISIDSLPKYRGMTCFISYDNECSTSPLVIEYISDNNHSGGDTSTKVPEPSIIGGFAIFSFGLLLKKKKI